MASKNDIIADQAKQIDDLMKRIAELELQSSRQTILPNNKVTS